MTFPAREFAPVPESVAEVREFVRETITELAVDHAAVLLMADELASNAVRHARTRFTVRIVPEANCLRVEVADGAAQLPVLGDPAPLATGGRGMLIVDRCATEWGVESFPEQGKSIWFECRQAAG